MLSNAEHPENAPRPMEVMLLGRMTETRLFASAKPELRIDLTGFPL